MKRSVRPMVLTLAGLSTSLAVGAAGEFVELIGAPDLRDWDRRGGSAAYAVEGREIVGRTVRGSPNTFLCTRKTYSDFILECDVLVDPRLNSGIQIRSESRPDYRNGVVFGYQVEVDPSARAWSGGIYDEQRRKWLATLENNEAARRAFRNGEWNHYKVEAIGDRIRTWVNGVPAADLIDGLTRAGFIGLQVHQAQQDGLEVRWRNLRVQELPLAATGAAPNTLTRQEREQGFELLWDGRSAWGWKSVPDDGFPTAGWQMKDGVLTVLESGGAQARAGGDIMTEQVFSDFDLCLEFRLTPGANSGVKYFVTVDATQEPISAIGLEYQLLDDERHPDAKLGRDGNRTLASLYDLMPAAATKKPKPIGEWNEARIVSRGTHVEHWLNGEKVLEYERGSEAYRRLVAESKFKAWPAFGEWPDGAILLQDHGQRVSFRNMKIRRLARP